MAAQLSVQTGNGGPQRAGAVPGANFEELIEAYHAMRQAREPAAVAAQREQFERVQQAFEQENGDIVHRWFGTKQQTGVLLTKKGELYLTPLLDDDEAADLCFSALAVQEEARRAHPDDFITCGSLLYPVVVSVLKTLDGGGSLTQQAVKTLTRQLDKARETFVGRLRRRARLTYSAGVFAGTVVIFVISLLTYWVLPKLISHLVAAQDLSHVVEMFTACLNAGGAGALLSVMTRMSSGSLQIRYDEESHVLFAVGGFRPVIGGLSGVAVYVLYKAQLLPLQVPPGGTDFFVFGGLAFLAGFSERLAQDALMQTDRKALGAKRTPS
jgi:hypothetical protein